jgi:predicted dehydrogenase
MAQFTRREFLGTSALAAGAFALPGVSEARVGPNDILRVAVCGVKGRGGSHVSAFGGMKDVQVAAVVDIDERVAGNALDSIEKKTGKKPAYFQDFRKMLEDKSIDAVSIATCNHTHTLIAIHSVLAGKHVYVEKPLSHNVWEGRQLVNAARKHSRIVQHGTQSRSSGACRKAASFLAAGKLGKVQVARGLCYKRRPSIGKTSEEPVPQGVNYDLWLGPAPERPFTKNRFHYNWHWHWDYGNGDIGNQGVHEMDKARWYLGKTTLPNKVISVGGRFGYEDDGETPNTQIVLFDYGDSLMLFEVRGLDTDAFMTQKIGQIAHAEKGHVAGTAAFGPDNAKIAIDAKDDGRDGDHFRNFINAIKSGKHEDLNADVLDGHLSSALCHLGNISYRLGELQPMSKDAPFGTYDAGNEAFQRMREHLKANGVNLEKAQLRVGPLLSFDPQTEKFVGNDAANKLITREYRKPFVVPEVPA